MKGRKKGVMHEFQWDFFIASFIYIQLIIHIFSKIKANLILTITNAGERAECPQVIFLYFALRLCF
jgi:hypothetical protein